MRNWMLTVSGMTASLFVTCAAVSAENPGADPAAAQQPQDQQQQAQLTEAQATDRAAQQGLLRLEKTLDATVTDAEGEDLCEIEDVAIDPGHQQAAYAVVSTGGFLGLGDKQVVVPFTAIKPAADQEGLQASFDKQQIEEADEFDDDWESLSNKQQAQQIHQQFDAQPYWERAQADQGAGAMPEAGEAGAEAAAQAPGDAEQAGGEVGAEADQLEIVQASELMEQPITAAAVGGAAPAAPEEEAAPAGGEEAAAPAGGEEVGTLRDLIVDMREGKLVYAIITRAEAEDGRQLAAVPFSALQYQADQQQFALQGEAQTLAPLAFAEDSWPDLTSEQWASNLHQQFDQQPYWQVFGYGSPGQAQGEQQPQQQQQQPEEAPMEDEGEAEQDY